MPRDQMQQKRGLNFLCGHLNRAPVSRSVGRVMSFHSLGGDAGVTQLTAKNWVSALGGTKRILLGDTLILPWKAFLNK